MSMTMSQRAQTRAFTLIEVMVAVSIFATVMLVATGAIFSIVEANKKAHSIKSVMTNLNFALESMSRDIRVGSNYQCSVGNCASTGGEVFTYQANRDVNGSGAYDSSDQVRYSKSGTRLMRQILGGSPAASALPITAEEISITNLRFYQDTSVGGQPRVMIVIQGYSGTSTTRSDFNIQTTVSQRVSD